MQNTQKIRKKLVGILLVISLITLVNTAVQNAAIWYTIDMFYFLIPLTFSLTCATSVKNGTLLATLLWVPLFLALTMVFAGLFFTPTPLWNLINMTQVLMYSYVAGTGLRK